MSDHQWGTVREDYSDGGNVGTIFPMSSRDRKPIAGAKMACWAFVTRSSDSALVLRNRKEHPLVEAHGQTARVAYEPAESTRNLFGGNSNWRGPVWFLVNYLLIESLPNSYHCLGDDFTVECPTGSGN